MPLVNVPIGISLGRPGNAAYDAGGPDKHSPVRLGAVESKVALRRPKVIEAWEQPARPVREDAIPVGSRIFHQKFGYGTVKSVEDDKLDIAFDKAGDKRLLDRFVERA